MRTPPPLCLPLALFLACGGTSSQKDAGPPGAGGADAGSFPGGGNGGKVGSDDAGPASGGGSGGSATGDAGPTVCSSTGVLTPIVDHCDPNSPNRLVEWGDMMMSFEAPPVAIAAGGAFGAILQDGTVAIWGLMDTHWTPPAGLGNVKSLSLGEHHALALTGDGTLVAWGRNDYHQIDIPADLTSAKVKAIAAGQNFSLAVTQDNRIYAWGDDRMGQVSKLPKVDDPQSPLFGATIVAVGATGYNSNADNLHDLGFALKDDGTVVSWGDKYSPTGGTGFVDSTTLTKKVVAVAGGDNHAVALYEDGTVGTWGRCWGQECALPTSTLTDVVAVAAGGSGFQGFSVALKSDGTLVSTGNSAPAGVSAYWSGVFNKVPALLTNIQAIAGGESGLLALGKDGSLYYWTAHGDPRTSGSSFISATLKMLTSPLPCVTAVAAGSFHTLALKSDGTVIGWGDNSLGQLDIPAGLSNVKAIVASEFLSVALRTDGSVVQWGYGRAVDPGACDVISLASSDRGALALRKDGTVLGWGDASSEAIPVPASLGPAAQIAVGDRGAVAVKPDGSAMSWRVNTVTVPANLAGQPVLSVAAGYNTAYAIKADGTVFAWALYDGGDPIPIAGEDEPLLSPAKLLVGASSFAVAIKPDGTLAAMTERKAVMPLPANPGPYATVAAIPNRYVALLANEGLSDRQHQLVQSRSLTCSAWP